ncbi:MAG: SLATT domain-containing protein [Cyanobacteriota bacterium]|nr:SLATT domain-containing protein [Cyanobacteriota bacterium]
MTSTNDPNLTNPETPNVSIPPSVNDPNFTNPNTPPNTPNMSIPPSVSVPPAESVTSDQGSLVQREDIMNRAEDRRNLCRILSRAHILVSIRWSNTHLYIGIPSTVFAALAGVQAIAELGQNQNETGAIIHIVLSILVAGLAPLLTFLNPNERATTHQTASRVYEQIGDRYDAFLLRCLVDRRSLQQELDELVSLNLAYSEEKKPLPLTPEWAFQQAKRSQAATLATENKRRI